MARVNIVGDGPGGLSAAHFLAKNGHEVTVYGQDKTVVNSACLYNYLGIPEIADTEFQGIARQQVQRVGAIVVDANYMSSIDKVYVVGRSVRPNRSQVIISAGAGAVAALDILAREEGKDVQDWDAPPKD